MRSGSNFTNSYREHPVTITTPTVEPWVEDGGVGEHIKRIVTGVFINSSDERWS
jgi:hypothetical protein